MVRATRANLLTLVVFVTTVVASVTLAYLYHHWQPWVAAHTGSAGGQESNGEYAYWSGFGSVFPWEAGFVAGIWLRVIQTARHQNCHVKGCWRLGRLPVGDYTVCKRHHVEVTGTHVTIEHLKVHHHLHKRKRLLDAGYQTKDET